MDCQLSSTSSLPWIWIVETLASSSQVDESLLYGTGDLVKKTPEISSDLGKNARELVSLRILERLFVIGARNENPVSLSSSSTKIGFDPLESCEAVLERISRKLKDAILTGGHPLLSSLKEKSGLAVRNQPEHRLSADDGDTNHAAAGLKESNATTLYVAANGHLISPIPVNGDVLLKRSWADENLLVAKRNRSTTTENVEGQSHENEIALENGRETHAKASEQDGDTNLVSSREGKNSPPGDCRNEHPSLKGLVGHDEVLPCEEQLLHSDTEVPKDKSGKVQGQDNHLDEAKADKEGLCELRTDVGTCEGGIQPEVCNDEDLDGFEHSSQRKASNVGEAEDDIDHNQDADMSCDSEGYNDEKTDIAMKKNAFLSSQFTYSQDSLATTDLRERDLCTKCKRGGTLLVCSRCILMVHEGCLGSAATFDAGGKFYCPFCAYLRAIEECNKVEDKASVARKDLATFIRMGTEKQTKEVSLRSRRKKKSQPLCREDLKDDCVAEPSKIKRGKGWGKSANLQEIMGKQQIDAEAVCKSGGCVPSARVPERSKGNEHAEVRSKKKVLHRPETDLAHQLTRSPNSNEQQISEEENESSGASKYFISIRKQGKATEGVQKFFSAHDRNIPWKQILEFGAEVFQKGRTTIDLKDKWRNICKGSPKSK
ncbi:uncharacterized protein Fot_48505 [Forsythia ovata]|uniref:Zinc finger PHD-type domain-containing protein n=1 Tax=Forsythia ovata TaxID=205694 RepID=A0ABD1QA83_9LAMI